MTIQTSPRSALVFAATLAAVCAFGFAGTSASLAATDSVFPPPPVYQVPADSTPAAATADAAPADQQTDQQAAPAVAAPPAANAVADSSDPAAATAAPDATANVVSVSNDDNSGWDKASIVGKIFIACGTLLTLGSAARMFMV